VGSLAAQNYTFAFVNGTLTITNVAPTVKIRKPTLSDTAFAVNTSVSFGGSFTDPGSGTGETYTATWTFDNLSTGGTVTTTSSGDTVAASYTFTATGVYDVVLTVTDSNGGSGTANTDSIGTSMRVVIYDPTAGFVTGSDTINTPAGSLGVGSTVTGQANFGYVAQYKKGSTTPTGETEVQFPAGNINFHSSGYDWLVVNAVVNDAWSQYQGTGTINNATPTTPGDVYKFYVASEDGQWNSGTSVDKFRMKIWEQNSSGGVVNVIYDNQWGAPDTAGEPGITPFVDLKTPLTHGDITLHKVNAAQATGVGSDSSTPPLTQQQLAPIVQQAIAAWSAAGISAQQVNLLRTVPVYITNLPGAFVGMSSPDGIWIDRDAAGYSWFIDPTPGNNSEFGIRLSSSKFVATPGSPAYGKMDLLTIVEHEMGRPLGLQESPNASGVMAMKFQPGVRELPVASDLGVPPVSAANPVGIPSGFGVIIAAVPRSNNAQTSWFGALMTPPAGSTPPVSLLSDRNAANQRPQDLAALLSDSSSAGRGKLTQVVDRLVAGDSSTERRDKVAAAIDRVFGGGDQDWLA
jgi:hypothetical protein